MAELFRYAAFISYSSKDATFARRLHRSLERYRVPSQLGAFDLIGGGKKNRIYPVFRDREEMPAGKLVDRIDAALKASASLIVICSPKAAASKWVNREIETFVALGRKDRIFAIIADTAPVAAAGGTDATAESFPPAFDANDLEPVAADTRKSKGRFRYARLKLIAGLIGKSPGDLIDRDKRRRRQQILTTGAATLVTTVAVGAIVAANRAEVSSRTAEQFARESSLFSSERRYTQALLTAVSGDPAARRGPVEQWLYPDGHLELRAALVGAYSIDDSLFGLPPPQRGRAILWDQELLVANGAGLELWNPEKPEPVFRFEGHPDPIGEILIADGHAISASRRELRFWKKGNEKPIRQVDLSGFNTDWVIAGIATTPDGTTAVLTGNGEVALIDAQDRMTVWRAAGPVRSPLIYSARHGLLFGAEVGDTFVVRRVGQDEPLQVFDLAAIRFPPWNLEARFWPNGEGVVLANSEAEAGSQFNYVVSWAFGAPQPESRATILNASGLTTIALAPDRRLVFCGFRDGAIVLWDLARNSARRSYATKGHYVTQLESSADGSRFLSGFAGNGGLTLWRTWGEDVKRELATAAIEIVGKSEATVTTSDGRFALGVWRRGKAALWDVGSGQIVRTFAVDTDYLNSAAVSSDGKRVLLAWGEGNVAIWQSGQDTPVQTARYGGYIAGSALTEDGALVFVQRNSEKPEIWKVGDDRPVQIIEGSDFGYEAAVFSPEGAEVIAGDSAGELHHWRIGELARVRTFRRLSGNILEIAVTPDWTRVAASSGFEAGVWNIADGALLRRISGEAQQHIGNIALSSDGSIIALGLSDDSMRVHKVGQTMPLAAFGSTATPSGSFAFLPDDRSLLIGTSRPALLEWSIPPIVFATPHQQIEAACNRLRLLGMTKFTEEDAKRFPELRQTAFDPCRFGGPFVQIEPESH